MVHATANRESANMFDITKNLPPLSGMPPGTGDVPPILSMIPVPNAKSVIMYKHRPKYLWYGRNARRVDSENLGKKKDRNPSVYCAKNAENAPIPSHE